MRNVDIKVKIGVVASGTALVNIGTEFLRDPSLTSKAIGMCLSITGSVLIVLAIVWILRQEISEIIHRK